MYHRHVAISHVGHWILYGWSTIGPGRCPLKIEGLHLGDPVFFFKSLVTMDPVDPVDPEAPSFR